MRIRSLIVTLGPTLLACSAQDAPTAAAAELSASGAGSGEASASETTGGAATLPTSTPAANAGSSNVAGSSGQSSSSVGGSGASSTGGASMNAAGGRGGASTAPSGGASNTALGGASMESGGAGNPEPGGAGNTALGGASTETGGAGNTEGGAGNGGSPTGGTGAGAGGPYTLDFVGNITTSDGVDFDGKTFADHWDQITPENAGKWGSVQSNPGSAYNWGTLDAIYDYTEREGIVFKQHAFVWGSQQPGGSISEADVREWMTEFCARYPNTKLIDVVNEPPPHTTPSYVEAIGGGTNGSWQWIVNAFVWAREACPNAILILNDYSNIEYPEDFERFVSIVKTIQAAGAPIDAVGAQSHDLDDDGMELATVQGFVERMYAETGLPLYITEMDINQTDDQAQLRYYQDYFPYFRDSGYVKGLTIWGWIYGRTWSVAPNSGLVRDGNARPAMTWLMEELGRPVP